jgi:hypothetical protein
LFFDVRQRHHIRSLSAAGWPTAEGPQTTYADTDNVTQSVGPEVGPVFFNKSKPHCFRPAKNWVAFFIISLSSLRSRFLRRSQSLS